MALFSDGLMCDSEALREYESSVLSTAATEDISLEAKLRVAQREIEFDVVTFLLRYGSGFGEVENGLRRVVVTDAMRHWHAVKALECVYRDAYHHHLNDRFREKAERFAALARAARQVCLDCGIGIVADPIPRPEPPVLEVTPGGAEPARTLLVSIAWHRGMEAGAASEPVAIDVPAGHSVCAKPAAMPAHVDGWSVYAGADAGSLVQQGRALGRDESWVESGPTLAGGQRPPRGQGADYYVRVHNILQRG